jgi:hypothetical protein
MPVHHYAVFPLFAQSTPIPLVAVFRSTFVGTMAQKALAADLMRVALGAMLPPPRGKALAAPAAVAAAPAKDLRDCLILILSDPIFRTSGRVI